MGLELPVIAVDGKKQILDRKAIPTREGCAPCEIVLCYFIGQYVSYLHNLTDGGYYYGRYAPSPKEGVANFNEHYAVYANG